MLIGLWCGTRGVIRIFGGDFGGIGEEYEFGEEQEMTQIGMKMRPETGFEELAVSIPFR